MFAKKFSTTHLYYHPFLEQQSQILTSEDFKFSVRYLKIYLMFIALTRKQKIFGILLSSNTLLKMSLDKGS